MRVGAALSCAVAVVAAEERLSYRSEYLIPKGSKINQGITSVIKDWQHFLKEDSALPDEFTWSDVDGKSYLTKNLNQHIPQYCGSCWAHGSMSALGDRVKIQRKAASPDMNVSIQFILNCGTQTAGSCYGGSHLAAYEFVHDYGHIPLDTGNPYMACSADSKAGFCGKADWSCTAENIQRTCNTFPEMGGKCVGLDKYPKVSIDEYGPVSGVDAMKKEIHARGPIACGVNADPLRLYDGGIFDKPDADRGINHVVSIVGWGKDAGGQHWIVRNSWGEYWGDFGFFKVRMGGSQLGLEDECAWAVPAKVDHSNFPCGEDGTGCIAKKENEEQDIVVA